MLLNGDAWFLIRLRAYHPALRMPILTAGTSGITGYILYHVLPKVTEYVITNSPRRPPDVLVDMVPSGRVLRGKLLSTNPMRAGPMDEVTWMTDILQCGQRVVQVGYGLFAYASQEQYAGEMQRARKRRKRNVKTRATWSACYD